MKKLTTLLFLFLLSLYVRASDNDKLRGAWLEEGVKWMNVRADVNPHLQWAQAGILYFDKDNKFGLIYCTVNRVPGKYMIISAGDPRGVYKGEWKTNDHTISITYQLVEATVLKVGEKLPGPMKSGTIEVPSTPIFI